MWLLWSGESRLTPSQQSGNRTRSRSVSPGAHSGRSDTLRWLDTGPQLHEVMPVDCGDVACASPATILSDFGNTRTGSGKSLLE